MEEIKKLVADIKTICMDRLDSVTADGLVLGDAFKKLEELLDNKKTK